MQGYQGQEQQQLGMKEFLGLELGTQEQPELALLAPLSSLVLVRKELLRRRLPKGRQELMDKLVRRQQS